MPSSIMRRSPKCRLSMAIGFALLSVFLGFRLLAPADFNYRLKRSLQTAEIKFAAFRGQNRGQYRLLGNSSEAERSPRA